MIHGVLLLWFILTAFSLIYVIWDQVTNTPSVDVMKFAWALVILYTGPLGLFFYLTACRQPMPGTHDAFINKHWKQTIGSEIHFVAGDATAIIIMAGILFYFPLPNGLESILEYIGAYLFGLFIFQALFMRSMYKSYGEAVFKSLFAETVSMNMVMAGMIPTILLLKGKYPQGGDPFSSIFWGIMSLATIVGFVFAYPINSWMVKRGIKHGMMSKPQEETSHQNMDHHAMKPASGSTQWALVIGTFAFLFLVTWAVSLFVPIQFTLK